MVAKIATTHINSIFKKNPKIVVEKKGLYSNKNFQELIHVVSKNFNHGSWKGTCGIFQPKGIAFHQIDQIWWSMQFFLHL